MKRVYGELMFDIKMDFINFFFFCRSDLSPLTDDVMDSLAPFIVFKGHDPEVSAEYKKISVAINPKLQRKDFCRFWTYQLKCKTDFKRIS